MVVKQEGHPIQPIEQIKLHSSPTPKYKAHEEPSGTVVASRRAL
jgi:hypothetical protein